MRKTRQSSVVVTRKIVSGEHLNPNGTLFGGHLMSWMDEVAFMCARRYTAKPTCVTVNIDNITFRIPIRLGENIILSSTINHVGQTSMEIQVNVEREDPVTYEMTHTNSAHLTFVCLDESFKPIKVPELILESDEDHLKNREARLRIRVRRRLIAFLKKRKMSERESQLRPESANSRWLKNTLASTLNRVVSRVGLTVTFSG